MKVTKKDVNAVLRKFGYGNIKLNTGSWYDSGKTYRDWDGKMVKGATLASHSPMDVTSAGRDRANARFNEIVAAVKDLGFDVVEQDRNRVTLRNDESRLRVLLYRDTYPTYARSADLDEGYVTEYLMVSFAKG